MLTFIVGVYAQEKKTLYPKWQVLITVSSVCRRSGNISPVDRDLSASIHHCDKVHEIMNSLKVKFISAHSFRGVHIG